MKRSVRRRAGAKNFSTAETEEYFRERASRADIEKVKRILERAGKGNPPLPGDEIIAS